MAAGLAIKISTVDYFKNIEDLVRACRQRIIRSLQLPMHINKKFDAFAESIST